jgi:pimeloyl-ACP methyl ester carboxylesterase
MATLNEQLDAAGYPVAAERRTFAWRGYRVAYYVAGDGPPLLLVHSINAAASAFEMRKPFAALRENHRVYALEFLGYGGSDRPPMRYSAEIYSALIGDFVREVVGSGAPAIASSLGSAYLVRAAAADPALFGPLILICPTGIRDLARPNEPGWSYDLLRGPFGDLVFRGLASRPSIAYFLRMQSYFDPAVVDELTIEGFHRAAYQAGAKYAPICFLTGLLNCDIGDDFARLTQPIQLIWGRETTITPLSRADGFLKRNNRARIEVIDRARLSVQDERPEEFLALTRSFLANIP